MALKRVIRKRGSLAISPRYKDASLASADADKERSRRIEEMKKFADRKDKKAMRKLIMKRRPRQGVDKHLESIADQILKEDRVQTKKNEKAWRYKQNTRERKEALLNPNERIKTVRTERLLKKMAGKAKPKFRAMNSDRTNLKMVSQNTQAALIARRKAKAVGQEAGVLIAKYRKAKDKKAALTAEAKNTHRLANRERDIARASYRGGMDKTLLAAVKAEGKNMMEQGKAKRTTRRASTTSQRLFIDGKMPHLTGFKISDERGKIARQDAKAYRALSKEAARKSGGTATGMKRTAEAAIGRIAQGKQYKSVARLGGALGIASMFAQALKGTEPKKKKRG